ncbi:hypothetical protein LVD15_14920 [Fulvivirga maritima]|uniref:hypothetical protein n=1 Tax=Fulvivirga maritima TaxID=2904247 RepID=UPI001F34B55E|nr:hypothetical protein [Fulvivirga maritima]UII24615.1 hypothetical protein LVD15_14920 [Fulvivirga maritima]
MKYFSLLTLSFLILISCGESEDKLPDNVIENSEGIIIDLEWSTGGSSAQSLEDADLELYLYKGTEEIASSAGYGFEDVSILSYYGDGAYTIKVELYNSKDRVDYSLYLNGIDANENMLYESYFLSSDKGAVVDYLRVVKDGNRYTITNL